MTDITYHPKKKIYECNRCDGSGRFNSNAGKCFQCDGAGKFTVARAFELKNKYWPEAISSGRKTAEDAEMELSKMRNAMRVQDEADARNTTETSSQQQAASPTSNDSISKVVTEMESFLTSPNRSNGTLIKSWMERLKACAAPERTTSRNSEAF